MFSLSSRRVCADFGELKWRNAGGKAGAPRIVSTIPPALENFFGQSPPITVVEAGGFSLQRLRLSGSAPGAWNRGWPTEDSVSPANNNEPEDTIKQPRPALPIASATWDQRTRRDWDKHALIEFTEFIRPPP